MKITICGSIAFKTQMNQLQAQLEALGHEVKQPPAKVYNEAGQEISVEEYYRLRKTTTDHDSWVWQRKAEAIQTHFEKVVWADAALVANFDKNGVVGYIGANTLIEMGVAFYRKKPIYVLNSIPEMSYTEEILGMQPIVVNGDLAKIT